MQIVPALAATSTSLPAPPVAQGTTQADPFGQMLLALLTGAPVAGAPAPPLLAAGEPAEPDEAPESADADTEVPEGAAAIAGLAALMQAYVQPAPQPAQAEQTPAGSAAIEGEGAVVAAGLPLADEAPAAPSVATAKGEASAAPALVAVAPPVADEPQAQAIEPRGVDASQAAAVSLPHRLPLATPAAADGGATLRQSVDEPQPDGPWVAGLGLSQGESDEASTLTAAAATSEQPETAADGKGEAYARVAAAKRFAPAPTNDNGTATAAVSFERAEVAAAQKADLGVANGTRPTELLDRVAGQIRVTAESGGGEARLHLQPESLGRIDISVKVQGGQVSVSLTADSPAVQHVISTRLPDLVSALTAGGMTVAQASVDVSDQSRQQQAWAQEPSFVPGPAEEDAGTGSSSVDWLQPMSIVNLSA